MMRTRFPLRAAQRVEKWSRECVRESIKLCPVIVRHTDLCCVAGLTDLAGRSRFIAFTLD
jgi:hypothetical protein